MQNLVVALILSVSFSAQAQSTVSCFDIFSTSNFEANLFDLQARISIEGESALTDHALYNVYYSGRRFQESLDLANASLARNPNDAISLFNKAQALYSLKRFNQALLLVNRLIDEVNPKNEDYLELKSKILGRY